MRWKSFGATMTDEGRKLYFSGRDDSHAQGVGFLVHKDNMTVFWDADQLPAVPSPYGCELRPATS